jgi:hypothetical protein
MLKWPCTVVAVVLTLCVTRVEAIAQGGICAGANTCSEAFFRCVAITCPRHADAGCTGACRARFDVCKATGDFGGPECKDKALIRK